MKQDNLNQTILPYLLIISLIVIILIHAAYNIFSFIHKVVFVVSSA